MIKRTLIQIYHPLMFPSTIVLTFPVVFLFTILPQLVSMHPVTCVVQGGCTGNEYGQIHLGAASMLGMIPFSSKQILTCPECKE